MNKDISQIRELLASCIRNQTYGQPDTAFTALLRDKSNHDSIRQVMLEYWDKEDILIDPKRMQDVFDHIDSELSHQNSKKPKRLKLARIFAIAAALLAIFAVSIIVYQHNKKSSLTDLEAAIAKANIRPGRKTATLTLASGRQIVLDQHGIGQLAQEPGVSISKNKDGELVYTIQDNSLKPGSPITTNTLTTAKGQTAKVILPDGTKVWLNAASSITYPSSFAAAKRREVSLIGEAYFDVTHNPKQPFIVTSNIQQVEVLGTTFDISAYHDDDETRTTLLEGSIKLSVNNNLIETGNTLLTPGQQATMTIQGKITKKEVNTDNVIDWKNGYFAFDKEPLGKIMNRVGRWYDVDIIFEDPKMKEEKFYGTLSRYDDFDKMLKAISKGGAISFTVQGKTIKIHREKE